ncbi:hypothetical protein J3R30DRAFT_752167 [Lentinula aciculospora]|uniref:Uncharacterized protein n=1 Tax=Lentinula aciculospora TaxID=153920 RepID=A0A9W9A3F7_9AGAR|nr:hypothetical protein J3R30DRAFT_752167 [Lentinula aciculospora]
MHLHHIPLLISCIALILTSTLVKALPLHEVLKEELADGYAVLDPRDSSSCIGSTKSCVKCLFAGGEFGANPLVDLSCARAVVNIVIPSGCIACLNKYGQEIQRKAKDLAKKAETAKENTKNKVQTEFSNVKVQVENKVSDVHEKAAHVGDQILSL